MNGKSQLTMGRQDDDTFVPSSVPSTATDLKQLEDRLDKVLHNDGALESGTCPTRRRIYNDLFDELIRMTTVHCSERGQLLERVSDEYKQWMNTYEGLYSSSMAYAMRQYLCRMEEKKKLESAIGELERHCEQLRGQCERESVRYQEISERAHQQQRTEDPATHSLRTDVRFLRSSNEKIRRNLDNALGTVLSSSIFLGEEINYEKRSK